MKQTINFDIKHESWMEIFEKHTGLCGIRIRINKKFANDFLSKIIASKYELKCELFCVYNRIKAAGSRKKGCMFWRGLFKCKICKSEFEAEIQQGPNLSDDNSFMRIVFDDQNICKGFFKANRSSGEKRLELANKIMLKGYSKLKSENTIYNSAFPDHERMYLFYIFLKLVLI